MVWVLSVVFTAIYHMLLLGIVGGWTKTSACCKYCSLIIDLPLIHLHFL